ncbi:hypothetical protein Tco_0465801 [Tanacetum coccineum]|uniref:Xylulose kinase-1 n=1 Tax=Tanacetum coccineum TaxID=301880 RepID=A0ABQ4XNR2_9ASTR
MVAYLQKSEGSEGFHQIVDFLNTCHIKYALIENPTIYVSLIEQFWQTATARTLENGYMEITATIDGKVNIVSEASIRIHLKLEDYDGISTLPTTEIFEQLALMGGQILQGEGSTIPETEVPQLSSPTQTHVADEAASIGVDDRHGGDSINGRKIAEIDEDLDISLVQQIIHHDAQTQGSQEYDLEPNFEFTAPKEVYTTEPDISTANVPVSTAGAEVSTTAESLVYIRRSAAKRKDKEAQRLQEQFDEKERQRIESVHKEASTFKPEEWDTCKLKLKLMKSELSGYKHKKEKDTLKLTKQNCW